MKRKEVLKYFIEQKEYMNDRVKKGIKENRNGRFVLRIEDMVTRTLYPTLVLLCVR